MMNFNLGDSVKVKICREVYSNYWDFEGTVSDIKRHEIFNRDEQGNLRKTEKSYLTYTVDFHGSRFEQVKHINPETCKSLQLEAEHLISVY